MMLTMQEFMELVDYKITEGGDYTYAPFGPYAYQLSHWNEKHDDGGYSFSIVFDTKTQEVYSVEAHDYPNNRSYRMIDQKHQTPRALGWDDVNYVDLDDVNDFLEKAFAIKNCIIINEPVEKELVLVECIQSFRVRYVVEVPKGEDLWALDTVTMQEANEFSQESLGEVIVSHRVVSTEEVLAICDIDNDYCNTWTDKKKLDTFVTTIPKEVARNLGRFK